MLVSQLLNPTLREVPAEAEVISHQLMVRAGLIRKSASGLYTFLPLGLRVLRKIETIVREEMDAKGGQEVLMPIMQPAELWKESGRWDVYGAELFRLKDRHNREFCLGPTHEEIITDLVRGEIRSYKQLPMLLYQIQNKYRDERRPRFGLMRGREFIMKDLYSFDRDEAGLHESYQKMYDAYCRIFARCGLSFRPVEADAGAIGGTGGTHEFMVLADSGENSVVYCSGCDYAANTEKSECRPQAVEDESPQGQRKLVPTPGVKTIESLSEFLAVPKTALVKSLLYQGDDKIFLVLVRGDRTLNEIKLNNALGGFVSLQLASPELVKEILGCEPGSVGPVDTPAGLMVVADEEVPLMKRAVCGANQADHHYTDVVPSRDFRIDQVLDLRMVEPGEACLKCGAPLKEARGIEVGQVFKLGTKYSKALGANFLDENGVERSCVMGCYGVGVSRTMAAAIEQNNDEFGIIWPMPIAPYQVIIVPTSNKDALVVETADKLYQELQRLGVEVVLDDRDERAGVKFKDADLVGYPIRVTLGSKTLANGQVELKERKSGETHLINIEDLSHQVKEMVKKALKC
ncbi:prolyl-tRNA synthetase, family II [Desulfosporosinus orientis DSM 765]|uniref:Proline--tRNA ligase n=1 Tax=Desulfosporosinus orientis (strain ATCC 19365 / DSM 765 / NCIMB 8382 / VKM B-1628 / Singapore I) TaxID=768706 RepID=G7WE65_DESOD|nr:proline--tRNA ligase [Desulfosporosinus orientis]AET70041.1 prolyl-tRNA synthetase, family II [Desulfosporosinus orientis DSM 765]